jgi:2',3'-cyclic-nucleotide 2'-phosphodiesterase (5'-nucleotidase family)
VSAARRLVVGLCLLLAAGEAPASGRHSRLTVLFTSDLHGHVLPVDDVTGRPAGGSIAQVATVVRRIRAEAPAVVVLDGGDAIEGTPLEYLSIAAPGATGTDPTIAAMNAVRYDAAVLGNHEFNFGLAVLERSLAEARFPWLAANLDGAAGAGLHVGDELILRRGGVRIGILGLTNPNVPRWDPPEHWAGLAFRDPVEVARTRVPELRRRADLVVVVVHSGFECDLDTGAPNGTDAENFACRLARVPGIDLLLTGHTHRNIPPRTFGDTIVAQPGRWADTVTRIDLDLERLHGKVRIAHWEGHNIPTAEVAPATDVLALAAPAHAHALAVLDERVAELAAPLITGGVPARDDGGVDLIHAVQLEATGAQLSLAAPLAGRRIEFPAGPVTARMAFALYPYPNTLVVVRLTGAQLVDVLEHAVRGWVGVDCRGSTCTALRDPSLPGYNYDTLEGATYLVDLDAPAGHRIRALRVGGALVRPDQEFTVAINSYRAAGGGDFPHLRSAPRVASVDRPMVELILAYCRRHRIINPEPTDNWAPTLEFRSGLAENVTRALK